MPNQLLQFQLGRVGALSQLGSVTLITLFIGALYRSRRHHAYFSAWFTAWGAVAVALAVIVVRNSDLAWPGAAPLYDLAETHPLVRVLYGIHNAGRVAFLVFLARGAQLFAWPREDRVPRWALWLVSCLGGVLLTLASPTLDAAILRRSVVAAPVYAACALAVLSVHATRRSLGTSSLALAFAAHGSLRLLYVLAGALDDGAADGGPLGWLLSVEGGIESLCQTLLAYGMVLVVMEETTRETEVARTELEVAHHALRRAAYTDPLSAAGNRRAFVEGVGLEEYTRGPATVAILDLDNLKAVNDALGHEAGDTMIRHVATTLRLAIRPQDVLYRWGGDEFLIVFPGMGVSEGLRLLDETLGRAAALDINGVVVPVRASVGCVSLEEREDMERAIQGADRAMYESKVGRRVADSAQGSEGS